MTDVNFCCIRAIAIKSHDVAGSHPISFSNIKKGIPINYLVIDGSISLGCRDNYSQLVRIIPNASYVGERNQANQDENQQCTQIFHGIYYSLFGVNVLCYSKRSEKTGLPCSIEKLSHNFTQKSGRYARILRGVIRNNDLIFPKYN